jgi:hypothetical protein
MTPDSPKTSSRLVHAVTAELAALDRHSERLVARREELQTELDQVHGALVAIEERMRLLNQLTPLSEHPGIAPSSTDDTSSTEVPDDENGRAADRDILRGTAIRETAVRLLAESPEAARPIHYKRLFQLLWEAGFAVAGKNPLATFLTQLSRSPVMRKTTEAGVYELDAEAPERLRRRLAQLQSELRAVTASPTPTDDLAAVRERREQVLTNVAQVERALEEAARVLDLTGTGAAAVGAA